MRLRPLIPCALLLFCGCASSGEKSTRQQDNLARERAFQFNGGPELAQRATYDLHCPQQSMEATVLQRAGMFAQAVSAGVRGCGLQATYMRMGWGAWVLNGGVAQDPTQYQQAPPPPPGTQPPPPGAPPPPPAH
jgi:hypothetical protein